MHQEVQLGANLGIGECIRSEAFTPTATAPRKLVPLPPRPDIAAWLLTIKAWPTSTLVGANRFAYVIVNSDDPAAAVNILRIGTANAPAGGTPYGPGDSDTFVIRADRDSLWLDARGVDATLAGDAAVTIEVEVHALYATPKCPMPLDPDCAKAPEKRRPCA